MQITRLELDEVVADHIAAHRVRVEEVEEVCFGTHLRRKTRRGRLLLLGQTSAGRYLVVVLEPRDLGTYRPITARDMTRSERAYYRRRFK